MRTRCRRSRSWATKRSVAPRRGLFLVEACAYPSFGGGDDLLVDQIHDTRVRDDTHQMRRQLYQRSKCVSEECERKKVLLLSKRRIFCPPSAQHKEAEPRRTPW